ncbi:hypothetical protein TA3x_005479 [Tundrisphaera sp. TA3]|uniref:hypothetical protein n=1 Tax=Tundrisphaera sp. TA3 TaxID=3435775 RepID=UPI003EC04D51
MPAAEFAEFLLDCLEDFDRSIPPLGLYAAGDLPECSRINAREAEWHCGLLPRLKASGCSGFWSMDHGHAFDAPGIGPAKLKIIKISKIKVRKFGSHYRVDRLEDFSERWGRCKIDKELSRLWKPSSLAEPGRRLRLVLFIGFDKAEDPFARELQRLKASLDWSVHGVTHTTRVLEDRYERHFRMRFSVWWKEAP